jgi:isopentenyldiphosphate isomerase
MVQQAQPAALIRRLSQELGVSPQELEERARQSRLGYAAQVAALQDGCGCRACRLLRQSLDGLVDEAMKEIATPPPPVLAVPVEG